MLLAFVFAFLKIRISKSHTWTHTRPLKMVCRNSSNIDFWLLRGGHALSVSTQVRKQRTRCYIRLPCSLPHRPIIHYCASLPHRLPWKKSHDGQTRIHHSGYPTIHHSGHYRIHMMAIRGFTLVAIKGFTWWPSEDSP